MIGQFDDSDKVSLEEEDQLRFQGWETTNATACQLELVEFLCSTVRSTKFKAQPAEQGGRMPLPFVVARRMLFLASSGLASVNLYPCCCADAADVCL